MTYFNGWLVCLAEATSSGAQDGKVLARHIGWREDQTNRPHRLAVQAVKPDAQRKTGDHAHKAIKTTVLGMGNCDPAANARRA